MKKTNLKERSYTRTTARTTDEASLAEVQAIRRTIPQLHEAFAHVKEKYGKLEENWRSG